MVIIVVEEFSSLINYFNESTKFLINSNNH